MHSGIGGLAHVLAEIRLSRPWTVEEEALADVFASRHGVAGAREVAEHAAAVLLAEGETLPTGTN